MIERFHIRSELNLMIPGAAAGILSSRVGCSCRDTFSLKDRKRKYRNQFPRNSDVFPIFVFLNAPFGSSVHSPTVMVYAGAMIASVRRLSDFHVTSATHSPTAICFMPV